MKTLSELKQTVKNNPESLVSLTSARLQMCETPLRSLIPLHEHQAAAAHRSCVNSWAAHCAFYRGDPSGAGGHTLSRALFLARSAQSALTRGFLGKSSWNKSAGCQTSQQQAVGWLWIIFSCQDFTHFLSSQPDADTRQHTKPNTHLRS